MNPNDLIPNRGWLHRYVEQWTPKGEAPATSHLAAGLAVLSAAIGWRAFIRWGNASEPCCLYVVMEGRSATAKKTTVTKTAVELVKHAFKDELSPPVRVQSIQHTSNKGLLELVGAMTPEIAKEWDKTPPPGVLLDWDEFGGVLGRPGDSKSSDYLGLVRAALMAMYGGYQGGIQTGGCKVYPSRCSVAVLATMTRIELEQRVSNGLLRDGFLGRFLLIPNEGRRDWLATPPEWTAADSRAQESLARDLKMIAESKDELGDVFKKLTPAGRELRKDWYRSTGERLDRAANDGSDVDMALSDAFGRLQSSAMKVAAVIAVSEMMEGDRMSDVLVDERHIQYGNMLAEFAMDEIRSLATAGQGLPTDRFAVKVVDFLARRNGKGPCGRKELLDSVAGDGLSRSQKWSVVESLYLDGTVHIESVGTSGRPRQDVSLSA